MVRFAGQAANAAPQAPLIAAQFCYLYAFEALFAWTRGRPWRLTSGPSPIILSTNLFIWFKDDWFVFQFAMITAGLLELPAKVVASELYYFPIYHCRSFEAYDYLQRNMASCDRCLELLADPLSRQIYRRRIENLLAGRLWDQSLYSANPYFGNEPDC